MGRQVELHLLQDDCQALIAHIRSRDPVVVVYRDADGPDIEEVCEPCRRGGLYSLWNQAICPVIQKKFIAESNVGPYYSFDEDLPLIEFTFPEPVQPPWNGRPALTQGRLYTGFNSHKGIAFESWYNAIVRWIRKNFIKNPVPLLGGYLGPAAHEWYKTGGVLLPVFRPPLTSQWLSWLEAQDQHRALFSE